MKPRRTKPASDAKAQENSPPPWRGREAPGWLGLVGMLAIIGLRCIVLLPAQAWFDVDPAFNASPVGGFGPGGSLVLDALLSLAAALTMAGECLAGRRISAVAWILALAPAPILWLHASHDAGDFWRGSTWLAAMAAAAAVAHAARDRDKRIVIVAALAGVVAIVLARGISQEAVEQRQTIAEYERGKQGNLAQHEWAADSSAARIFERRLKSPGPIGWFDTTNVFASLAGFAALAWGGLAIAAKRRGGERAGWAVLAFAAVGAGALLALTRSKGAVAAACVAGAWMTFMMLRGARQNGRGEQAAASRWSGWILPGLCLLVLLAVVIRGVLLPEGFAGEKSLLFRWHYMAASARMLAADWLRGVGPDGYQQAYILHRVARSPEEVVSAHSMFIDWIAALGVSGLCWAALAMTFLWRAGRNAFTASSDAIRETSEGHVNALIKLAAAAIAIASIAQMGAEWPVLDVMGIEVRVFGAAAAVIVAAVTAIVMHRLPARDSAVALAGGAAMLAMHGQIEMTFHQPGAVAWAMTALAAAGASGDPSGIPAAPEQRGSARWIGACASIACAFLAVIVLAFGAARALRQEAAMREAAMKLQPVGEHPDDLKVVIEARRAAAESLVEAYGIRASDVRPLDAAARQLDLACSLPNGPQPVGLMQEGLDLALRAVREHPEDSGSMVTAIILAAKLAQATGDPEHWSVAIDLARRVADRDPHGIGAWRRLGDALWIAGRRREAAEAYRKALEADANFVLDDLKRLSDRERAEIERRAAAGAKE